MSVNRLLISSRTGRIARRIADFVSMPTVSHSENAPRPGDSLRSPRHIRMNSRRRKYIDRSLTKREPCAPGLRVGGVPVIPERVLHPLTTRRGNSPREENGGNKDEIGNTEVMRKLDYEVIIRKQQCIAEWPHLKVKRNCHKQR